MDTMDDSFENFVCMLNAQTDTQAECSQADPDLPQYKPAQLFTFVKAGSHTAA